MAIKVYLLKYPDDCGCDTEICLDINKAFEWLESNKEYKGSQILEYVLEDDKVSDMWNRCWFYSEDNLHSLVAKDYLD